MLWMNFTIAFSMQHWGEFKDIDGRIGSVAIRQWADNLRNEAERCGIERSEAISMNNLYDEFRKVLEKEFDDYKLNIIKCVEGKRQEPELKVIGTINDKGSKELYILSKEDGGYIPLYPGDNLKYENKNLHIEKETVKTSEAKTNRAPLIADENIQSISQDDYRKRKQSDDDISSNSEKKLKTIEKPSFTLETDDNSSYKEHLFDPPQLSVAFDEAIRKADFTRGIASNKDNNCLLYSLKTAIDKTEGIESNNNDAAIETWVNELRKAATDCGFGKHEFLGVTDIIKGTPDEKFRTKLAEGVLKNYVLETWGFNEIKQELELRNSLIGVNANENSKVLYVFYNGENHYEPLFSNVHRQGSYFGKVKVSAEEIEQKIKEKGFTHNKAEGEPENSFLYSLKEAMDKKNGVTSDEDNVKEWVKNLRKKAWMSGYKSKENVNVKTAAQDERQNFKARKFLNHVKKELGEYALVLMEYDPNVKMVNEAEIVIGERCDLAKVNESGKIYLFDNGNGLYDPLFKDDGSPKDGNNENNKQESSPKIRDVGEELKEEYGLNFGPQNTDKKNSLLYSIMTVLENEAGVESNKDITEKWISDVREKAQKYLKFKDESNLHVDINKEDEKTSAEQLGQILEKALDENILIFWYYNSENDLTPKILAGVNSKNKGKVINIFDDGNYHYAPLFPDANSNKSTSASIGGPSRFMNAINKELENLNVESGNVDRSPTSVADADKAGTKEESAKDDNSENIKGSKPKITKDIRSWFIRGSTSPADEKTTQEEAVESKAGADKNDNSKYSNVQTTISDKILVPIVVSVKRILGYLASLQKEQIDERMLNIQNDYYQYVLWKNLKTVNKILIRNYKLITKLNWDIKKFELQYPEKDIPKELIQKREKIVSDLRSLSNEIGQNAGEFLNDPNNKRQINTIDKSIIDIRGRLNVQCNKLIECARSKDDDALEIAGKNLGFGDDYSGLKKEINDKKQKVLKNILGAKNFEYRISLANHQIDKINTKKKNASVSSIVLPKDLGIRFLWDQKLELYNEYIYYCNKMLRAFDDKANIDKRRT